MTFFEIANSPILYILVIIGLIGIIAYAAVFLRKSYSRCLELGFSKDLVMNVIKSSLAFTVVPSIAIVVGLVSLSLALGIPWPWWRLSVVGSVGYELMAADLGSKAMGFSNLATMASSNDGAAFTAIMYIMTVGIISGLLVLIPFGKKMTTGLMKKRTDSDSTWGVVLSSSFMLTLVAVFLPIMIITDKVSAATLFTSAVITFVLGMIVKKFKVLWLSNFILAITLIVSMIASVGWQSLLN